MSLELFLQNLMNLEIVARELSDFTGVRQGFEAAISL
jgi:hypothetical protein